MSDQRRPQFSAPPGGSMPAGLEEPPRYYPPNPQHPEIIQTYDPRVSTQLERAARDRAAGQPGLAAREDIERAAAEPPRGAGPQPLRPPRVRPAGARQGGEAGAAPGGTLVVGAPPRETVVTFTTQFASYFAGESAAFTPDEAARLGELGVVGSPPDPPATEPPANTAVPHVQQESDVLTCTMGEWTGTPTAYSYQWQLDGADAGTDAASYPVQAADVGQTATCVVTATNAAGSTAAPPSVGLVVTEPEPEAAAAGTAPHRGHRK